MGIWAIGGPYDDVKAGIPKISQEEIKLSQLSLLK